MPNVNTITIPEDPNLPIKRGKVTDGNTLAFLQSEIGGLVDCIDVRHPVNNTIATIWFHDEGKINGMDRNERGMLTAFFGGWDGWITGDWIAGPVVITGHEPETGETVTTPYEWLIAADSICQAYAERNL